MFQRHIDSVIFLLTKADRTQPEFYNAVATVLEVFYITTLCLLLLTSFRPIPYGRYSSGAIIRNISVPGKLFWKLFVITWIIPILVIFVTPAFYLSNPWNVLGLFLYVLHYFHRSVIYPTKLENASPWPIDAALYALLGCAANGLVQGIDLLNVHRVSSPGVTAYCGLILFFGGLAINATHDDYLLELRRNRTKSKVQEYLIPKRGLFSLVSAANYLGEIVEWWGLALFTGSTAQFMFALSTTVILGIRGIQHHNYYRKKFGKTYPSNRKAIIPWIL